MSLLSLRFTVFFLIICVQINIFICEHQHSHRSAEANKERVSDGTPTSRINARSESAKKHYEDDEHFSEFDHEAVLGSRGTAEEFDQLPPAEAKKRLRVLALAMDKNKDNNVDPEELIQWFINSFRMLNKEEADERHEESDSDNDGFVTWDEYVDENYGLNLENKRELADALGETDQERKMLQEDKALFNACDNNGDGKLTKSEFVAFIHPQESPKAVTTLADRTMADRDKDKDGYLTYEEFIGEEGVGKDKEWQIAEKDKFNNEFDTNHDGKLSVDEVKAWLIPDDTESAKQEAKHLVQSADNNKDGILSIEEILDNHDLFVGSEATDYGQYLHELHKFNDEL